MSERYDPLGANTLMKKVTKRALVAGVAGGIGLSILANHEQKQDHTPLKTRNPAEKPGGHQPGVDSTSHLDKITSEHSVVLNKK